MACSVAVSNSSRNRKKERAEKRTRFKAELVTVKDQPVKTGKRRSTEAKNEAMNDRNSRKGRLTSKMSSTLRDVYTGYYVSNKPSKAASYRWSLEE